MFPNLEELYMASTLKLLQDGRKDVIIYGTAQEAAWAFQSLRRQNIQVRYFCDPNPVLWGTKMLARRIIAPHELPQHLNQCELMVARNDWMLVSRLLDYMDHDVPLLAHTHYALHTIKYALENEDRVRQTYDLLADDYSKRLLIELLKCRMTLKAQHFRTLCTQPKYFPPELFALSDREIFVDGGTHNGETIVDFLIACRGEFEKVHAFEPDERCMAPIRRRPLTRRQFKKVIINQAGLGEKDEVLHLKMAQSAATGTSEFSAEGGTSVQVRSLDSYLAGEPITFLKLDVEKHERFALRGAAETIGRCKPKLAICVYHLHDDLWEIPLLIHDMVPDYRIYLRHHSWAENETVMYAVAD